MPDKYVRYCLTVDLFTRFFHSHYCQEGVDVALNVFRSLESQAHRIDAQGVLLLEDVHDYRRIEAVLRGSLFIRIDAETFGSQFWILYRRVYGSL